VNYYVIRVAPRREQIFLDQTNKQLEDATVQVLFPRRKMFHLRKGKRNEVEVPLFPGYVFLRLQQPLEGELYLRLKNIPGFASFLKNQNEVSEILGPDLKLLSHFLRFGEVVPVSQVWFDDNQRIRVHTGPMEGLEGQIIHVDKRKRRAKIRLDFDQGEFTITLAFELLEKLPMALPKVVS